MKQILPLFCFGMSIIWTIAGKYDCSVIFSAAGFICLQISICTKDTPS